MLFLGRISFSLYLLHSFIIAIWSKRFFYYCSHNLTLSYKASFALTVITTLPLVFAAAYTYTIYVDEKAIRVGQTLYRKALTLNTP